MQDHNVFHTPGAFGNYVGFLLDYKIKGKLHEDPFNKSGSSHNRVVHTKSHDIVLTEGHDQFKKCSANDIGIYWPEEYFFYILHSAYGRTNHGQYGSCGVTALQQNTWQWLNKHEGHKLRGNDLSLFVKDLDELYGFKCSVENQIVPENTLRHYFFFHFVNHFKNKLFVKNKEISQNTVLRKLNIEIVLNYTKLKNFLEIPFDFNEIHEKFIDENLSLVAYYKQKEILQAVKQNKDLPIRELDVITQAGILFELEKQFYDIPFFNLNFNFKNTKEIQEYITQYPNYMRRPNNLFMKHWKIYNDK